MRKKFKPIYSRNPKLGAPVKPWEFSIPSDFVLLIDTREQSPLFVPKPPKDLLIKRTTLPSGDYSCLNWESSIAFERKTIEDLCGCLGKDRDRFRRELDRLCAYERKYLIIEAYEHDLLRYHEFSQMEPNAIRGSLVAIELKYCPGIIVHYEPDRAQLERWVLDRLLYFTKFKREGNI